MQRTTLTKILFFALAYSAVLISGPLNAADEATDTTGYTARGWLAKSLPEQSAALRSGTVTSEALVEDYLSRIRQIDRAGPTLQSILVLNPDALTEARVLDASREAGETLGPLHGIPVLLKDNIESKDAMATTAGALALEDNISGRDSPLVAGLRKAGAIILGKTNLSQWANFRSEDSMSGWSALGGQVRNPHMLDRNPCGSSSGSAAAVAASLAAGAVGTETNGSVICPANANGIVGFKPTVGLVSQQYIIPISSSQDTAGPMTKTVTGSAMMLEAMATGPAKTHYSRMLDAGKLKGARVGVLRFAEGESTHIKARFDEALAVIKAAGAKLVEIEEFEPEGDNFDDESYSVLKYEFKHTLNEYLASTPSSVKTRSLEELIAFNQEHAKVELALFDQGIFLASQSLGGIDDPAYITARNNVQSATRERGIDLLMQEYNVSILVAPSGALAPRVDPVNGDVWPAWAGAGGLAAKAGYPHLTVPMGTFRSIPIGLSFIAGKDQDAAVLSYGFAYEQATKLRAEPTYLKSAEDRPDVATAMKPGKQLKEATELYSESMPTTPEEE
ncbi:MAG: amidase [Gammaproteobacteria bacterium]|nr:amidase [Gammaproteobacteria bacterium]